MICSTKKVQQGLSFPTPSYFNAQLAYVSAGILRYDAYYDTAVTIQYIAILEASWYTGMFKSNFSLSYF